MIDTRRCAQWLVAASTCLAPGLAACTTDFEHYRFDRLRASAAMGDASTTRDGDLEHAPEAAATADIVHADAATLGRDEDLDGGERASMSVGAPRVQQLGSSADDFALGTATDSRGNVYLVGVTEAAFEGHRHAGGKDTFLVKFTASGDKLWSLQFGTPGNDMPQGIALDHDGDVYVVGFTNRDLGSVSAGGADVFVTKFNPDGERQWMTQQGSPDFDIAEALAIDEAGDIYVVGRTEGEIAGRSAGGEDLFVLKYASDGSPVWRRQLGTVGRDRAYAVVTTTSAVFVAGFTTGALGDQHAGKQDAFLARYDTEGQLQWLRQFGSPEHDFATSLAVDARGDVYLAGYTAGELVGASQGNEDLYVTKYSADGERLWLRQFGTGAYEDMRGLTLDSTGHIYLSGTTYGALPGQQNLGDADMLLAKLDPNGEPVWARQLGTGVSDEARALTLAGDGSVFIAGATQGSIDGTANQGKHDVVVAHYDAEGHRL